ncbi:MAG: TolC family protein [Vicinamibacteria bacterium]|nr:TolC family protein [Vicinamibacteria bacterium]
MRTVFLHAACSTTWFCLLLAWAGAQTTLPTPEIEMIVDTSHDGRNEAAPETTTDSRPPLLTLSQAIDRALLRNDRLINADDGVEQAHLSLRLARSAFRPKLVPNIHGSFGQSDTSNQTYRLDLSQRFITGTELRGTLATSSDKNQLGTFYNTDTTLAVSQPLLRGFGRVASRRGLSSAEARLASAEREKLRSEQQVMVEVTAAYYRIATQQQMADVVEKSLERARRLLAASEAKLEVGKVSQLDVLRARQLSAQTEGQLLNALSAVEDATDQLRLLIDYGPDEMFTVESPKVPRIESIPLDEAIEVALARRPEIDDARESLAESERALGYERNQLLPQLDLNLALTRREVADSFASSFGVDRFDFATFVTLSMPVDRTPQTIAYHNAMIERDRRRRTSEQLKRQIMREVRLVLRQQLRLKQQLDLSSAMLEFAGKEAEVAAMRFERGLSNNLDVVKAEEVLLDARSRHSALLAEIAVSQLGLRQTLGILDPRKDVALLEDAAS